MRALFASGPDDGTVDEVQQVREFEGDQAVRSYYGDGYYALCRPEEPASALCGVTADERSAVRAHAVARWVPHPDAAFPWTVER